MFQIRTVRRPGDAESPVSPPFESASIAVATTAEASAKTSGQAEKPPLICRKRVDEFVFWALAWAGNMFVFGTLARDLKWRLYGGWADRPIPRIMELMVSVGEFVDVNRIVLTLAFIGPALWFYLMFVKWDEGGRPEDHWLHVFTRNARFQYALKVAAMTPVIVFTAALLGEWLEILKWVNPH